VGVNAHCHERGSYLVFVGKETRHMLNRLFLRRLGAFERAFAYDASYLREILAVSRRAFVRVARLQPLAAHREEVPPAPWYAAKLVATMHEDCGPCTQLVVDMARGGGVSPDVVRSVVAGRTDAMPADVLLGYRFARAVLARDASADELRDEVMRRWGRRGLISLALGIAGSRLYPTLKYALGHGRTCTAVRIDRESLPVGARPAA
jgi:hypothetical protein